MSLTLTGVGGGQGGSKPRRDPDQPEILLQAAIVEFGLAVKDGSIVKALALPWLQILAEIEKDASFLSEFAKNPRKFEEFLAGAYTRDKVGFDEVILTRSGDGGRDIIATKRGYFSIRILDQAKAYSPGHLVTHDDVRAMVGVIGLDTNSSKGIITTTSDFQPGIYDDNNIKRLMPNRLDLKNGKQLMKWLKDSRSG